MHKSIVTLVDEVDGTAVASILHVSENGHGSHRASIDGARRVPRTVVASTDGSLTLRADLGTDVTVQPHKTAGGVTIALTTVSNARWFHLGTDDAIALAHLILAGVR
jgi:hypothetical protein